MCHYLVELLLGYALGRRDYSKTSVAGSREWVWDILCARRGKACTACMVADVRPSL